MCKCHGENIWGTRHRSPLPTENIKHRLTWNVQRFSGQALVSLYGQPYGLPFPQVSYAGEPKEVFSVALAHPFRIIQPNYLYNKSTANKVFD